MKRQIYLPIIILIVATLIITSCKNDDKKPPTTTERLQAKWQVENIIYNEHFDDEDHADTYIGVAADYLDFRTDQRLYSYYDNEFDTSIYTVLGDTKIIIKSLDNTEIDTFNIQTLSDNVLKFNERVAETGDDYFEGSFSLKK